MTSMPDTHAGLSSEAAHALEIVGSMPALAWSADPAGRFTYFSPNTLAFFGTTLAELNETPSEEEFGWRLVVHPDDYDRVTATWLQCVQTSSTYDIEHRLRRADGIYCWFRTSGRPQRDSEGTVLAWHGVTIEIEAQKRVEAAILEREQELSQLVNMVPSLMCRLTPDGQPIFFNKRMIDFFGLDVGDVDRPGMSRMAALIEQVVHPDDGPRLTEVLDRSVVAGASFSMKFRLKRSDGVYRWMDGRCAPLRSQDGAILHWYGVLLDIEDEMRALEALRDRERFLWQLVETLPAMIDCAAPDGEPVYRSRKLSEFIGMNLEQLAGTSTSRLAATLDAAVHPDDLPGVKQDYAHSLATGEPYARRHRLRRADGEYRWVETRAAPMRDDSGAIIQWNVICLDIEGEMRAQEELRVTREGLARASQAASLAELSASIAHEVNQPLAAIVANSHACHRWLAANPPNLERAKVTAERIIRDANSAADVVGRIRALFNQSTETRRPTPLGHMIAEVHKLMADEARRRQVHLELEVGFELPPVTIDRVQMQQVLVNFMRNGMEAMEAAAADRTLSVRASAVEDQVRIEIRDNGTGISHPDRIFEPFFTTKDDGMGMGLAICRSIVEAHGGRLWAENSQPQGATLAFTLPIGTTAP